MAEQRLSDEHAQETEVNASPVSRQRLKRRGLIAGAAALVAGVLAKQASSPVSAWDSSHGFQSASSNASSLSPDTNLDGIQGYAADTNAAGVFGRNNVLNGIGVYGMAPSGIGVSGVSTSGPGVSGASTSSYGVIGTTSTASFAGVAGSTASSGAIAVAGTGTGGAFAGVFQGPVQATTNAGYGLNVGSTANHSIVGTGYVASAAGVYAQAGATNTYGLIAYANTGAYAAAFQGTVAVNGSFTVYGAKSAGVPHPDGSHRLLYCVESPESWFEDFGQGALSGGKATVTLDPDFAAVVRTDTLHVFLTPEGDTNGLYVTNKTASGFTVQEQKSGTSNAGFTYRVVAKRKDIAGDRLARVAAPPPLAAVPSPVEITLPGLEKPPVLPAVDTKASAPSAAPAPAPSVSRSSTPTATPAPTSTPVSPTATGTSSPSSSPTAAGTPAVVATPRATGSATSPPASNTPSGSVAPAPPRR